MKQIAGAVGHKATTLLQHVSSISLLTVDTLRWAFLGPLRGQPMRRREILRQMELIGADSVPIAFLIAFITGIILAMQTAYQLRQLGAVDLVGALVAVSLTRELGPLMTAIILSGRVGAGITAELGTMMVSEEILALEVMAVNPVGFLIAPRLVAILIMLPCLTMLADLVGIVGGYFVSITVLHIPGGIYYNSVVDSLVMKDIISGLIKSVVFAGIIAMVGCYEAFTAEGGAEGVGKNTMVSVVTCLVLVIVADSIFTTIFYFFL